MDRGHIFYCTASALDEWTSRYRKSTLAFTICERADAQGLLLASFLFSRTEDSLSSGKYVFSSVAYQCSRYSAELKYKIGEALKEDPDVPFKRLEKQAIHLVIQPLRSLSLKRPLSSSWMLSMSAIKVMQRRCSGCYYPSSKMFRFFVSFSLAVPNII